MNLPTRTLYRPVGPLEMALILESGSRRFPPRLPEQPIFYPVTNLEYAEQINRKWNATSGNFAGFATRFEVDLDFVSRYEEQVVGAAAVHRELWVPAEELEKFNDHIVGRIEAVSVTYGLRYQGGHRGVGALAGGTAEEQLLTLASLAPEARGQALRENAVALQLSFAWWVREPASRFGLTEERKSDLLREIRDGWSGEAALLGAEELGGR